MPFGYIIDKDIKSLCNLLWIFETRIAITIMTEYQHNDYENVIKILDINIINMMSSGKSIFQ